MKIKDELRQPKCLVLNKIEDPSLIVPLDTEAHYFIALDYNKNGRNGNPEIIHLELESDIEKKVLYNDFTDLIRGRKAEHIDSDLESGTHCLRVLNDDHRYSLELLSDNTDLIKLSKKFELFSQKKGCQQIEKYFNENLNENKIQNLCGVELLLIEELFLIHSIPHKITFRPPYNWTYIALNKNLSDFDEIINSFVLTYFEIKKHDKEMKSKYDNYKSTQITNHNYYSSFQEKLNRINN